MKTRKIGAINERYSMVEIAFESGNIQYAVVVGFNENENPGSQWDQGWYFNQFSSACRFAADISRNNVSYERMAEIAARTLYRLVDLDENEAIYFIQEELHMEDEAEELFGIKINGNEIYIKA